MPSKSHETILLNVEDLLNIWYSTSPRFYQYFSALYQLQPMLQKSLFKSLCKIGKHWQGSIWSTVYIFAFMAHGVLYIVHCTYCMHTVPSCGLILHEESRLAVAPAPSKWCNWHFFWLDYNFF
jgi:hypothetical protein